MHTFKLLPLALSLASLSVAHAQDTLPSTPVRKRPVETSLSLGVAPQLTATRVNAPNLSFQSFEPSAAVLGSVRQSFKPWLGYSANFGYTRTTQDNVGPGPFSGVSKFAIQTNVYEVSLAYLVERHITPRITGFANLGGGVLGFLPVHRGVSAKDFVPLGNAFLVPSYISRPLGVGALGLDIRLSHSLAFRAEYRGLLYKYPDNHGTVGRLLTESSQPTLSLVYRFGGGKH